MRRVWVTALVVSVGLVVLPGSPAWSVQTKTRLVSKTSAGQPSDGTSSDPSLSNDATIVAFQSLADNLPGPNGTLSVYVRNRTTGTTRLISKTSSGDPATGGQNREPDVSGNGRFVAFESSAANLPGAGFQVYVRDTEKGKTRLVSKTSAGVPASDAALDASISDSGRFVAFRSMAGNLPGASPGKFRIYVRDRKTGKTRLASKKSNGDPFGFSALHPDLSGNGRVVAFTLQISAGKICEETVVYAHDRRTKKTRVVSKNSSGVTAEGCSDAGSLSGNGRYVAFHANAGNLPGGGMPGTHSYVHDRKTATTRLVTRTSSGTIVIGAFPVLSSSGAWVAFGSNDPALPGAAAAFQVYARGPL